MSPKTARVVYVKRKKSLPSLVTVTSSLQTKWTCYSQALLERIVPEWRRIVIDGRRNWSQLGFVDHVTNQDVEFVLHVDEDCFVSNRSELLRLIQHMQQNPNIVAAGIPDGGHYYRECNPAALNLFFCLFRLDALREAWRERESWSRYGFHPAYGSSVFAQRPDLDHSRVSWRDAEAYYPLFWCLLSKGGRFLYLREQLNRSRWSTYVSTESGQVIAEHLWYLRNWFSQEVMPGHDCPNRQRYERLRNEILVQYRTDRRFLAALVRNNACRYRDVIRERAAKLFNQQRSS